MLFSVYTMTRTHLWATESVNIYNYLRFIKRNCQRVSLEKRKYFLLIQTSRHHIRNKIIVISFIWNIRKCMGNFVNIYSISKPIRMGWRTVVLIKNLLQEHGTVELFAMFQSKNNWLLCKEYEKQTNMKAISSR